MKFITASKLLVLPIFASINAVEVVEKDAASKVNPNPSSQKKTSFLKDHRSLHQQKLHEFKKKARNLEEYSEETQKLLNCYINEFYPGEESRTYTVKKLETDQMTIKTLECPETYKTSTVKLVFCEEAVFEGADVVVKDTTCIPDIDTCPNDFAALMAALADAHKADGDDEGYEFFSMEADFFSKDRCAYPQCFPQASEEFTFTFGFYGEHFFSSPYSCPEIGGSCEVDCEGDNDFDCLPGLCYANKDYDQDYIPNVLVGDSDMAADINTKSLTNASYLRPLKKKAGGHRKLKSSKSSKGSKYSKASKATKSSKSGNEDKTESGVCTCKVSKTSP